ncbi:MAG: SMI1/KNR4 family protein [Lachnospiraceae bacterium]|nr:SMI1/KNR4 family protein [Lachnospiraceae bacterium]
MKNITRENAMEIYKTRDEMWKKIRKQHNSLRDRIEAFYHLHEDMLPDDEYFTMKKPSGEEISLLEKELGFSVPEDYKWFLNMFGAGGVFFEIYGYLEGTFTCLEPTLRVREELFNRIEEGEELEFEPDNLLVVSYDGEVVYGIDAKNGKVVDICDDRCFYGAENFLEFLLSEMEDTIYEVYA